MTSADAVPEVFFGLTWERLDFTLENTRVRAGSTTPALAVFEAILKHVSASAPAGEVIFHLPDRHYDQHPVKARGVYPLIVQFFGAEPGAVARWRTALQDYFSGSDYGRNFVLKHVGEVHTCSGRMLPAPPEDVSEVCLEFFTPYPFQPAGGRTELTADYFLADLRRRLMRLFGLELPPPVSAEDIHLLPYYWNYVEIHRPARSQPGQVQYLKGCSGRLYLREHSPGALQRLWPWLALTAEVHTGRKVGFGLGYFRLWHPAPAWFDHRLADPKALESAVQKVLDRYDEAPKALAGQGALCPEPAQIAAGLAQAIAAETYTPALYESFLVPKRQGGTRRIERVGALDCVVLQHLLDLLTPVIDKTLHPAAIGYRRGHSRLDAVNLVREARQASFQWVIEGDIADFFPSVSLDRLQSQLDACLPQADQRLRRLLARFLHTGYVENGVPHPRTQGLAQGNPLSPLLANLYLYEFDRALAGKDARLIRYADDFIALVRDEEAGESALTILVDILARLGLDLSPEKTVQHSLNEAFRFLGLDFGRGGELPDERQPPFAKPLYVTEPYVFLSVHGDALDIRQNSRLLQTFPLTRVSEIMLLAPAAFSSAVVKACTQRRIPITFTLDNGYHMASIAPAGPQSFAVAHRQAARYAAMEPPERLEVARQIVAAKIMNYSALFRQRYQPGANEVLQTLEQTLAALPQAVDLSALRGHEGAAARACFNWLDRLLDHADFRLPGRQQRGPDRVNSLLDFGYHLLFTRINATLRVLGLNPYLGFLHEQGDRYETLVCDLQEPFRPHVDRLLLRVVHLEIIKAEHFEERGQRCWLTPPARQRFLQEFAREMLAQPRQKHRLPPGQALYAQCVSLRDHLLDGRPLHFYLWDHEHES